MTPERIRQYGVLTAALSGMRADIAFSDKKVLDDNTIAGVFQNRFGALFQILKKLGTSLPPSDHFRIDLQKGDVVNLSDKAGFPVN